MNHNVTQVSDLVENMLQRVKTGELTTEYGLSFLEIKYHMLLTYLINLTYVVLRKCSGMYPNLSTSTVHHLLNYFNLFITTNLIISFTPGKTIERDPSIDRLIEIRTVLEKIRPIDSKLRYQIDKLVKSAISGNSSTLDPLNYKVSRHTNIPKNHMNNIYICSFAFISAKFGCFNQ